MIRNKQQKFRNHEKALKVLPPGVRTPGHRNDQEASATWRPDARTV